MRTLDDFDFRGKVVLVRSDLNSDVRGGRVLESERIRASSETIKELKRKGARVVVLAHQGRRPNRSSVRFAGSGKFASLEVGSGDFVSLKSHARFLNKYVKIKFVDDVCGAKAIGTVKGLKNGEAVLLDNIRFVSDEFAQGKGKKNELYKLVEVADVFVNDAFSVCHRSQASVVLFPRYLESFAGRLLEKEVGALEEIKIKNCLYVLGGAKPSDNIKLLKDNRVLACGLFGQTCLVAGGKKLGAQEDYLKKVVDDYDGIIKKLKKKLRNVEMPVDFAVKVRGRRVERMLEEFPCDDEIFDIGVKTIKKYVGEIEKAKAVFVKGPAGDAGDVNFSKGTVAILKAVSKVKGFSLIGGGHLNDTIKKYRLFGFSHVSLSGGALVRYIAGEKLPGLSALEVVGGRSLRL